MKSLIYSTLFLLFLAMGTNGLQAQSNSHLSAESSFETYFEQGLAYQAAGIYDSALVAFEKAYEQDPNQERLYNPLTKKYVFLGLFEEAKTRLRELYINHTGATEQDHEYLIQSGTCLTGFYEAMEGDYETALNISSISVQIGELIGRFHCAFRVMTLAEQYEKAASYIDTLDTVRNKPYQKVQYGIWGHFVETQKGNTAKADYYLSILTRLRQAYEQGAFEEEDGSLIRYYLALVHLAEGHQEKAIQELWNAYEMGDRRYYWWKNINPMLDELEGHPEYDRLMKQMKADIDHMRERYLSSKK